MAIPVQGILSGPWMPLLELLQQQFLAFVAGAGKKKASLGLHADDVMNNCSSIWTVS